MTRHAARNVLLALALALCALGLCWPGYAVFGNTIEPYVLGVPFAFAWVVGWVLLSFVAMAAYHLSGSDTER